jgi:hypothetical protein
MKKNTRWAIKALEAFRLKERTVNLDAEATNFLARITGVRQSQEEAEVDAPSSRKLPGAACRAVSRFTGVEFQGKLDPASESPRPSFPLS